MIPIWRFLLYFYSTLVPECIISVARKNDIAKCVLRSKFISFRVMIRIGSHVFRRLSELFFRQLKRYSVCKLDPHDPVAARPVFIPKPISTLHKRSQTNVFYDLFRRSAILKIIKLYSPSIQWHESSGTVSIETVSHSAYSTDLNGLGLVITACDMNSTFALIYY